MKRFVSLLLCLILLLPVFAGCSPDETPQLLIGYGRASITPEHAMPLAGYGDGEVRYFSSVADPIYVTAIAFSDQDNNTVLLMQYDLSGLSNMGITRGIKVLTETFGLSRDHIVLSATHTHSAPVLYDVAGNEYLGTYYADLLRQQTIAAGTQAMESLLPAEIYGSSIETKNLAFVRHYRMDDGSIVGDNFGDDLGKKYVSHTQQADPELQLLRFKRQGGKDVVVANFQSHALMAGNTVHEVLTSDFIGPMTSYVEENLDCHFAYFSGASGNLDPISRIKSENIVDNHVSYGQVLGQYAEMAFSNMKKLDSGTVKFLEATCTVDPANPKQKPYEKRLTVFSIGDVAFINNDYEMFSSNGQYIKENSPFAMTFITTIGYSSDCYVPDAFTFAYDVQSYEETNCKYAEGAGEKLAEGFVDLLKQLHPGEN